MILLILWSCCQSETVIFLVCSAGETKKGVGATGRSTSCSVVHASPTRRGIVPAPSRFHISLAWLAACGVTFDYPPRQRSDGACLLALVIIGFRGQVIGSRLHRRPVSLLRPQGARGIKDSPNVQSLVSDHTSVSRYRRTRRATHCGTM